MALFTGQEELGGGVVFLGLGEGGKVGKCSGYCGWAGLISLCQTYLGGVGGGLVLAGGFSGGCGDPVITTVLVLTGTLVGADFCLNFCKGGKAAVAVGLTAVAIVAPAAAGLAAAVPAAAGLAAAVPAAPATAGAALTAAAYVAPVAGAAGNWPTPAELPSTAPPSSR